MIDKNLKFVLWNVRGFGDPHRGKVVRKWVKQFHKDMGVLYLQELKARSDKVEFQMRTMFPDCSWEVDYSSKGRSGAMVIIMPVEGACSRHEG